MKFSAATVLAVLSLAGATSAHGAEADLSRESHRLASVLLDNAADFQALSQQGSSITALTSEELSPGVTRYRIRAQKCTWGLCKGGADLIIVEDVTAVKADGPVEYETDLVPVTE